MEKRKTVVILAAFFAVILFVVAFMNVKSINDSQEILGESVKSQLISISLAAREMIDVDDFISYNSVEDAEADAADYGRVLAQLRALAADVGAEYIYALKEIDGKYYFVFDTDVVDEEIFIEYEIAPVHEAAFKGKEAADIMNVDDLYGSFNTGAAPILKDGKVVGIVSTDIEDEYMVRSANAARMNTIILIVLLCASMGVMIYVVLRLQKRIGEMQQHLYKLAHYNTITGLPNRQYLLEYLAGITDRSGGKHPVPFALMFVDIDNFKSVNDNAGHDAGDELLHNIAQYLEGNHQNSKAFRPAAGNLNIAARIGGDEFLQVVSGVDDAKKAADAAQKLLDGFAASRDFEKYVRKYHVGLSIGVALYPEHSDNYHVLIKYADIAMYHAKNAGKNQYRIYSEDMEPKDEK